VSLIRFVHLVGIPGRHAAIRQVLLQVHTGRQAIANKTSATKPTRAMVLHVGMWISPAVHLNITNPKGLVMVTTGAIMANASLPKQFQL
jgi:hypothetical protein